MIKRLCFSKRIDGVYEAIPNGLKFAYYVIKISKRTYKLMIVDEKGKGQEIETKYPKTLATEHFRKIITSHLNI